MKLSCQRGKSQTGNEEKDGQRERMTKREDSSVPNLIIPNKRVVFAI